MSEYGKEVAKKMSDYMGNIDSVDKEVHDIQHATKGVEVRGALAAGVSKAHKVSKQSESISDDTKRRQDSVEQQFDDLQQNYTEDSPSDAEIVAARTNTETGDNHTTVGRRMDAEYKQVTAQLADTKQQIEDTVILIKPTMTTEEIQTLLNNGGSFKFVKGEYHLEFLPIYVEATCLDIQDDTEIFFEKGVILKGPINNLEYYRIINMEKKKNITLHDAIIFGDKHEHTGEDGEWGHGYVIRGSQNITLNNCSAFKCWGDGLYIGPSTDYNVTHSYNIEINGFLADDNRRQGISVTSVKRLRINDPVLKNTEGTNPSAGIDLEPNNNGNFMEDVVINNIYTEGNRIGIEVNLDRLIGFNPKNISIVINNHLSFEDTIGANIKSGLREGTFTGKIVYNNHQYRYSYYTPLHIEWYSDLKARIEINNPTIIDGNVRGGTAQVTASAISLRNYDVGNRKIGNIEINNPDIYSTKYFPVQSLFVEGGSEVEDLFINNPVRLLDDKRLPLRFGKFRVTDENNLLVYDSKSAITNIEHQYAKLYTNKGTDKITRFNLSNEIKFGSSEITFECVEDYRMDIYPDANSTILPLSNTKGEAILLRKGARVTLKRMDSTVWQITNMVGEVFIHI